MSKLAWLLLVLAGLIGLAWLVVPAWCTAGAAARRTQSLNNLHNLGISVHSPAAENANTFPQGTHYGDAGRARHGWPAHLLPELDRSTLYRAIDFDVAWDHPNNERALAVSIAVFRYPGEQETDDDGRGLIHYAANSHVIGSHDPLPVRAVHDGDGLATTILFGEVNTGYRPWGHPVNDRDPAMGIGRSPDRFGHPESSEIVGFLFCDGAARFVNAAVSPDVLKAMATWNGGERVDELDP